MYVHLLRPFFFLYLPPSLLNDLPYSSLFPGLGGVLLPLLRQPLDPGVSDRGLLAGGRRHAEGVHQQSRPLRCLQELTGLLFLFFLYMYMNFQLLHPSQCVDTWTVLPITAVVAPSLRLDAILSFRDFKVTLELGLEDQ